MSRPQGHGKITPHPSSVNGHEQHFDHRWLMYHDKVRTVGGLVVYDSSTMPPLPMLLFGGGDTAGELFIREAKYVLVTLSAWCHGGCATIIIIAILDKYIFFLAARGVKSIGGNKHKSEI